MRSLVPFAVLVATMLLLTACGGRESSAEQIAAACERQVAEVTKAAEEGDTPTAESSTKRLEQTHLVYCAGQPATVGDAGDSAGDDAAAGDDAGSDTTDKPAGDETGSDTVPTKLDPAARETFASTCGSCHTLSDAKATGSFGPNLDETKLDAKAIAAQIANGGGGMPPALLSGDEATSVAEYVAAAAAAN